MVARLSSRLTPSRRVAFLTPSGAPADAFPTRRCPEILDLGVTTIVASSATVPVGWLFQKLFRARSRIRGHVPKTRQTQEEAVGAISSLSEPQFSIACGDRPPHSLPLSFPRLIFSPLPLRRQSPFGVALMSLVGHQCLLRDLALLIAAPFQHPRPVFAAFTVCAQGEIEPFEPLVFPQGLISVPKSLIINSI